MFFKSVWNLSLCVFLILGLWQSSSAFYLPKMVFSTMLSRPLTHVHTNRELKPLLSKLMGDVRQIYELVEANEDYEQLNPVDHVQSSRNSELETTNHILMKTIDQLTKDQTEIDKLIKMRTDQLQSELTANVAAVEDLKSQIAKIVTSNDQKLIYGFFTTDDPSVTHEEEVAPEPAEDEDASEPHMDLEDILEQIEDDVVQGVSESPEYEAAANSESEEYARREEEEFFERMNLASEHQNDEEREFADYFDEDQELY